MCEEERERKKKDRKEEGREGKGREKGSEEKGREEEGKREEKGREKGREERREGKRRGGKRRKGNPISNPHSSRSSVLPLKIDGQWLYSLSLLFPKPSPMDETKQNNKLNQSRFLEGVKFLKGSSKIAEWGQPK